MFSTHHFLTPLQGRCQPQSSQALQNWIGGGGTLIVTADIFPLAAYESFTSAYGITGYTDLGHMGVGYTVATHPVTQGVTSYSYGTESTFFDTSGDGLVLGNNG